MTRHLVTNPSTQRQWYVVYTKARQEDVALENLQRQGFEAYLPRWKVTKRKQSLLSSLIEPFFPRYLFIHMARSQDNWAPIRSTRGVCGLVRFGGSPNPVPDDFIKMLKKFCSNIIIYILHLTSIMKNLLKTMKKFQN